MKIEEKTLVASTIAELRLQLRVIERQGIAWTRQLPQEAAKEAAVHHKFDPNLWDNLSLKFKDYHVDIVGDLAQISMLMTRIVMT